MSMATEFNLPDLVREALEGDEADPHVIADALVEEMSLDDLRAALALTLPDYVRMMNRRARRGGAAPRSRRWKRAAEHHADGTLALLRLRVFARGSWRFLGDCELEDVAALVEDRDAEALANAAAAERYRALRTAMIAAEARVVRDLPGEVLGAIFDA